MSRRGERCKGLHVRPVQLREVGCEVAHVEREILVPGRILRCPAGEREEQRELVGADELPLGQQALEVGDEAGLMICGGDAHVDSRAGRRSSA